MKRIVTALGWVVGLAASMIVIASCSGTNPAAAPAPPIEIPAPAVLKFVSTQGLSVDLSSLAASPSISAAQAVSKERTPDLTVTDAILAGIITTGPTATTFFNTTFLKPALDGIQELAIPVVDATTGRPIEQWCPTDSSNPTDTRCVFFTFSSAAKYLAGPHAVKVDFAPFDLDGDGIPENCSGNAAVPPICIRFWLGTPAFDVTVASTGATVVPDTQAYSPFIAGVFERPPIYGNDTTTPIDIGEGRFRVKVDDFPFSGTSSGFRVRFNYNYLQGSVAPRESKDIVFFFDTDKQSSTATPPCGASCQEYRWHSDTSQLGPRSDAQSTADSSRFAFEELVSSLPCFAGEATQCDCPGGGTVTVDASGNYTMNGCTNSVGQAFTGTVQPAADLTYTVNLPTFGDCTAVTGQYPLSAAVCSGQAFATCAGENVTCTFATNATSSACDATCDGTAQPVLKSLNLAVVQTSDNTSAYCQDRAAFFHFLDPVTFPTTDFTKCDQHVNHLSKYVDGGGFWSGASQHLTMLDSRPDPTAATSDTLFPCAIIPVTAPCYTDVDPANCLQPQASCESVGALLDNIFVDDTPYLPAATDADVAFPPASEFPLTPPF